MDRLGGGFIPREFAAQVTGRKVFLEILFELGESKQPESDPQCGSG